MNEKTISIREAIDALSIDNDGRTCSVPFLGEKDPIEIIDRVNEILATASVVVGESGDVLYAVSNATAGRSAVCTLLDSLRHSLVVAKALIQDPRPALILIEAVTR